MSLPPAEETTLVAVDGRDAVCTVIIRPNPDVPGGVTAEAIARGITKHAAGEMLLQIGRMWTREADGS